MQTENKPHITVLIPTYNRSEFIAECIDSILDQTLPASQIIVVNDGSTDNTKELCASYGNKIDYFEIDQSGKPKALNFGLTKVTGNYIWIFDDDDVALPNALQRLVEPLEKSPGSGFSYCTFYKTTTADHSKQIGNIISEFPIPDLKKRGMLIPLLESNYLGGASLFARTSCYHEVGPFDPQLIRSQDYEMAIKIVRRFSGVRVEGGPIFHYRQHEGIRGTEKNQFEAKHIGEKWLTYDQKFFRALYRSISLEEYLTPGLSLKGNERQALLQRINIMASKLLIPEMINDLYNLIHLNETRSFSKEEQTIIEDMINRNLYAGSVSSYYFSDFFKAVNHLSASSQCISMLRKYAFQILIKRLNGKSGLREVLSNIRLIFYLYS